MNAPQPPFIVDEITKLDVDALLQAVGNQGYTAVRGLFSKSAMHAATVSIRAGFDAGRDRPGMGEKPSDVMQNFQKLIIGTGAQTNYYVPRCVRVIYNPLWAEDLYGMHAVFHRLAQLRNHIQGHALDYAIENVENGLWTAARLQHYPVGGGFFAPHRDAISPTTSREAGLLKFIQILLLVTERGVNYERGGAYIETDKGEIDLEAGYGAGDVLVYDGRSMHGVADIDPHKLPDLKSPDGRIVALVTLYADMAGNDAQYRHYRHREFGKDNPQ
jgi:hypothetical protein